MTVSASRKSWSPGRVAIVALTALMATIAGCSRSKDKIPVAKVRDRVITLAQFEDSFNRVAPKYLPKKTGYEGLREFLDTLIKKEIMAIKADELGYDKDPQIVENMKAFRKMGLQALYLKAQVGDIEVTEEDIKDYKRKMSMMLTVKEILVDTPEEGEEVYRQLKQGVDFESLAKKYSKTPDASMGGRMLTMAYGSYAPEFQDPIFELPVGGFTAPLESPYGYFIIKVLKKDRRTPPMQSEEEIKRVVHAYKSLPKQHAVTKRMEKEAGLTWYMDNLRIVFEALPPDRPVTNPPPRGSEKKPILQFSEEDLQKPLATYKDKVITIKDFSDMYDKTSFFARPRKEFRLMGIRVFLEKQIVAELVEDAVKKFGPESNPIIKKAMDRKKEEIMVSKMFDELVSSQTKVTPDEVEEFYQTNIDAYRRPEQRRFGVILTGSKNAAMEAYERIKAGEDFLAVAMKYSIDVETKPNQAETDFLSRGDQPELDKVGFALENIGDVSEPFMTSKGWVILRLVERKPERLLRLDEVWSSVEADLKRMKDDERLEQLIAKWKKSIPIEIYEDNLKKAKVKPRLTEARVRM